MVHSLTSFAGGTTWAW